MMMMMRTATVLNKCVFSLDLKVACDGLDCISLGREFRALSRVVQFG